MLYTVYCIAKITVDGEKKFKSTGLAKMFAGRRKFFREPHVRHLSPAMAEAFQKWGGAKTNDQIFVTKLIKTQEKL